MGIRSLGDGVGRLSGRVWGRIRVMRYCGGRDMCRWWLEGD